MFKASHLLVLAGCFIGLQGMTVAAELASGYRVRSQASHPATALDSRVAPQSRSLGPSPVTLDGKWSPIRFQVRGAGPTRKYTISSTLTLTNTGSNRSRATHVDVSLEGNFVIAKRVPALEPGATFRYTAARKNLDAAGYSAIIGKHFTATVNSSVFESDAIPAVP